LGICLCGETVNTCVVASCTTDSECGPGMLCSSYASGIVCNDTAFACQTPGDTCGGDSDCTSGGCVACGYSGHAHACLSCFGP
jgi:hypothetical protein